MYIIAINYVLYTLCLLLACNSMIIIIIIIIISVCLCTGQNGHGTLENEVDYTGEKGTVIKIMFT